MKRFAFVVGMVVLVFAVSLWAQTTAPKPGPAQKKLEIWVGKWTYEGEYKATPLGPAGKYTGIETVRHVLGGFFVEFSAEEKGPSGTTHWFEIDGYNALNKKFMWNGFNDDGSFQTAAYTIEANTVNYSGTRFLGEKQYNFRGICVFAPDLMSFVDRQEVSVDGKTWVPLYETRVTKTKSSPK
jgi:hypothetical protein